jgi:hypothetical protein
VIRLLRRRSQTIKRVRSLLLSTADRDHGLAASMQTGVEIHLHQGKPGVRAANTHRVARRSMWLITRKPSFRTPVRTWTNLHLGTDSSSSECTPREAQTIDDSSRRYKKRPARWHRLGTSCKRRKSRCAARGGASGGVLPSARHDDGGGFAMFAPPICRRWRNKRSSVPADPTKAAATMRTSQRAE